MLDGGLFHSVFQYLSSHSAEIRVIADTVSISAIVIGIWMLSQTKRGVEANTTESLSHRMYEINKLEFDHPDLFAALGNKRELQFNESVTISEQEELKYKCKRFFQIVKERKQTSRLRGFGRAFSTALNGVCMRRIRPSVEDVNRAKELIAIFHAVAKAVCGSESKNNERKLYAYLFMLFSFYEQLFLFKKHTVSSFHESWKSRFMLNITSRPVFAMYWRTTYAPESTPQFRRFVEYIIDNRELPMSGGYLMRQAGCLVCRLRRTVLRVYDQPEDFYSELPDVNEQKKREAQPATDKRVGNEIDQVNNLALLLQKMIDETHSTKAHRRRPSQTTKHSLNTNGRDNSHVS
jgi:hypothetical protein